MFEFAYVWPYVGIGAGGLLLIVLFGTQCLHDPVGGRRWHDITWLSWLALAAYLLHQFEEHAVDATGAAYAFRGALCAQLGFADAASCPVPTAFISAVNVGSVWIAGLISALLARRLPAIGLSFVGVPFVNVFGHLGSAVMEGSYNAGLLSALLVFAPLSLWIFRRAIATPALGWRAVVATVIGGVAVHAVLLGSLKAYVAGAIGAEILVAIQVANGPVPALVVGMVMRGRPGEPGIASSSV